MSLLIHMISSGAFSDKHILAIDQEIKNSNDRTWCFWEEKPGVFEEIVHRRWDKLWFHGSDYSGVSDTSPFQYKMIRGIDFYQYCHARIKSAPNIDVRYGEITALTSDGKDACVVLNGNKIFADYIFSSIDLKQHTPGKKSHHLLQHFLGWFVETDVDVFDRQEATLMDFRVSQESGTAFVYQLPMSSRSALIEYTVFSKELLQKNQYASALRKYMNDHFHLVSFRQVEEEYGVIPMTNRRFPGSEERILYIGSAGGQTKPSTGYTFYFIQKQSARIVKDLILFSRPMPFTRKSKAGFYDAVLLNVLSTGKMKGEKLFTQLFEKNNLSNILAFLNNESNASQDIKIISSLPWIPFLKAGFEESHTLFQQ